MLKYKNGLWIDEKHPRASLAGALIGKFLGLILKVVFYALVVGAFIKIVMWVLV